MKLRDRDFDLDEQQSPGPPALFARVSYIGLTAAILTLAFFSWSLRQTIAQLSTIQALPDFHLAQHVYPSSHPQPPQDDHWASISPATNSKSASIAKPVTETKYITETNQVTKTVSAASKPTPKPRGRVAFATFLAKNHQPEKFNGDMYYIMTRVLTYQLLFDKETRSDIPFVVAVTPEFEQWKREQLSRDGATVIPIDHIDTHGIGPKGGNWQYVFDKLQLFNMTQYDRILFMDADTMIQTPMDTVFDDQAAQIQKTLHRKGVSRKKEAPLPKDYLLAAKFEGSGHATRRRKAKRWWPWQWPWADDDQLQPRTQSPKSPNYLNAGFFMLKPSPAIYKYYKSILAEGCCFNPIYPEQNLLNYAHRRFGNMPWTELKWDWNVHGPSETDFHAGIKSLHAHMWDPSFPMWIGGDRHKFWVKKKKEMERYFAKHQVTPPGDKQGQAPHQETPGSKPKLQEKPNAKAPLQTPDAQPELHEKPDNITLDKTPDPEPKVGEKPDNITLHDTPDPEPKLEEKPDGNATQGAPGST